MKTFPIRTNSATKGPLWRSDALERLHLLLPELTLAIVAATCLTTTIAYDSDMDVVAAVVVVGMAQALVQTLLYVCTYLVANTSAAYLSWLLLAFVLPIFDTVAYVCGIPFMNTGARFAAAIGVPLGLILFCLTRARASFAVLALDIVFLAGELPQQSQALVLHALGIAALAAMFVMRSSATRITMHDLPARHVGVESDGTRVPLATGRQTAALAAAVATVCLALSLAGTAAFMRSSSMAGSPASPQAEGAADGQVVTTGPSGTDGETEGQADVPGVPETGVPTQEEGEPPTTSENVERPRGQSRNTASLAPLALLLVLLAACSPFLLRLLLRARTRRAIQSERSAADRAARAYVDIVRRLEAAGIVRDETQTPREFLATRGQELEELTAPVGLGLAEWTALTGIYERARYAGLDPTEDELRTCWGLYDAIPTCIRKRAGWWRYLTSAFWRM